MSVTGMKLPEAPQCPEGKAPAEASCEEKERMVYTVDDRCAWQGSLTASQVKTINWPCDTV